MKENQQETELKLSKSQLQSVINTHIVEGDGLVRQIEEYLQVKQDLIEAYRALVR